MPDASARGPDVTASWISPENLDCEHLSVFIRALSNVLSTALAEETYAQIVDGLPTRDSYSEFGTFYPAEGEHPAYNHRRLCDGALDAARCFLSRLDPLTLRFDPRVRPPTLYGGLFIALLMRPYRYCKPSKPSLRLLSSSSYA